MILSTVLSRFILIFTLLTTPFADAARISPIISPLVAAVYHPTSLSIINGENLIRVYTINVEKPIIANHADLKILYKFGEKIGSSVKIEKKVEIKEATASKLAVDMTPNAACAKDFNCYGTYLTYQDWVQKLNFSSKKEEWEAIIGVTILSEYWIIVGQTSRIIHYTPGGVSLRQIGKEAIARNLYQACGNVDVVSQCSYSQLYRFLSGFSPWIGRLCKDAVCSDWASSAATAAYKSNILVYNYRAFLNNSAIQQDVDDILNYKTSKCLGWTEGAAFDRPWQWLNMNHPPASLGYGRNNNAIMYVDVQQNDPSYEYAVFFTFYQTNNR